MFAAALGVPRLLATHTRLSGDELFAALTAHSVASTGRDLNGRFMPLYFQMPPPFRTEVWFPPIHIYSVAAILKAFPLSEATLRLPMTVFAVIDVLLMYLVGRQLFRREALAVGAAVLLALNPPHLVYSGDALDFQAHLPFTLGWLLCLLIYLRRNSRAWLLGAGLMLGIGLYTYAAAYVLMPLYGLLTCAALLYRREPLNRFVVLATGFLLPAAPAAIFLLRHSSVAVDMFRHYQNDEGQFASAVDPSTGPGMMIRRLTEYGRIYGSFWTPRGLFVRGGQWWAIGGLFLAPVAGLLVAALMRLVSRPTLVLLLLSIGLLCVPLPASIVPQTQSMHRVAAMVPFGLLLAMMGLEYVWEAETPRARTLAFVAMWATTIGIAIIYHGDLLNAQAVVRAATVPLAVAGLAVLLRHFVVDWSRLGPVAVVGAATLIALQIVYRIIDPVTVQSTSVVVLTAIGVAPLVTGPFERLGRRPLVAIAALAVMSSMFMHVYVDHTEIPLVRFIRPSAMFLAARFLAATAALAALLLAWRATTDRSSRGRVLVASLVLALTQAAYYYIDHFPDFPHRFIQAAAVLLGAVGLARLRTSTVAGRLTLGQIAAAAVFVVASIQFAYFYVDYVAGFPGHPVKADVEGTRVAFETTLVRARNRAVPAVYLANVGTFGEMYWRFYAFKHDRPDLVSRTIADVEFTQNRVPDLPVGSVAVVGRSIEADTTIDRMVADRQLKADAVNAPDGTPLFWMLERKSP